MAALPFTIVDVFAQRRFAGNQLAVVRDAEGLTSAQMQAIARETNFSETTFVLRDVPRDGAYDVRIFTPGTELPFAGHPMLGTAWTIMHEVLGGKADEVSLHVKAGRVPVRVEGRLLWMRQPPPQFGTQHAPAGVAKALGLTPEDLAPGLPIEEVSTGLWHVMVPLRSRDALRRVRIDRPAYDVLAASPSARSFFCFAREVDDPENHVAARAMMPAWGIAEDPATGSANGCLAAYLARHRVLGGGDVDVRVEQGNDMGRPSVLHLRAAEEAGALVVRVGGEVQPVARGEILA